VSTARAAAASVSVTNKGLAISADSVWDGGTKATAVARGIDVGAGGETLTNDGQIDAAADAATASASIAVSMKGVAGASATATGKADAIAIDASAGDDVDTVTNNGVLTANATALSTAASISVTNQGLAIASGAVWDGGTKAEGSARGIDVGDGGDVIDNTGAVTVSSLSAAAEAAVGVAVKGVAGAVATSTSKSAAVALHAGDDDDNAVDVVTNSGTPMPVQSLLQYRSVIRGSQLPVVQSGTAAHTRLPMPGGLNLVEVLMKLITAVIFLRTAFLWWPNWPPVSASVGSPVR